jgi:hypothetical protein
VSEESAARAAPFFFWSANVEFSRQEGASMSSSSRLAFRGITRAIFACLLKKASESGIHVVSPAGETVKDGTRIRWNYDADAELLEVECVSAPFWISSAQINRKLGQEIEAALKSNRAA